MRRVTASTTMPATTIAGTTGTIAVMTAATGVTTGGMIGGMTGATIVATAVTTVVTTATTVTRSPHAGTPARQPGNGLSNDNPFAFMD